VAMLLYWLAVLWLGRGPEPRQLAGARHSGSASAHGPEGRGA
jgi:hypothetical protein